MLDKGEQEVHFSVNERQCKEMKEEIVLDEEQLDSQNRIF